ncbi:MAG: T9SS type A sorting domain-containing protein [Bacteroidales bacterium]|nr:T9SS type A sorting domain-containing protein [Bacteroidales bacterium]
MKKVIRLLLILLAFNGANGQVPDLFFEQQSPHPVYHQGHSHIGQLPYCCVTEVACGSVSDSFFLMTVNDEQNSYYFYEEDPVSLPIVYKLSQRGELLGEMTLGFENRYSNVSGVYREPHNLFCFLAVGFVHDNDLHYDRPFLARFDRELNLLWQKEVELPEPYRQYLSISSVMDSGGDIFCTAYAWHYLNDTAFVDDDWHRFCFRLTPEGELDGLTEYPISDINYNPNYNPFVYPDGSGDYGSIESMWPDYNPALMRFNHDLELVDQRTLPTRYTELDPSGLFNSLFFQLDPIPLPSFLPLPDGSVILGNYGSVIHQDLFNGQQFFDYVGFLKVSPEGEAVSCAVDDQADSDSIKQMVPQLPLAEDGTFYFVYMMGEPGGFGYDWMNCFVVGKMDLDGNLLWRRYWNRYQPEDGTMVYFPEHIIATQDNGCAITGFSYESDVNAPGTVEYGFNVFLLKFFANGTLDVSETESHVRPYAFSNPASEAIRFHFSPDVRPVSVELYDLQGRQVLTQRSGLESVDVARLPTGVYSMRVLFEDGACYTDKVVKQ